MYIKTQIKILDDLLKIEIGKIARNTAASVLLDLDGTTLLVTVVYSPIKDYDFLPLKVEYFERFYASGKIPFNYFKREGKPTEREILISRLIDRSIRPMLPKELNFEIQITITVLSINNEINPDILAINGTSLALALSGLPFTPIASIRIGVVNDIIMINPKSSAMKKSNIELVLSATNTKIVMLEGSFNEIKEELLLECLNFGLKEIDIIIKSMLDIKYNYKKPNINYIDFYTEENIISLINNYHDTFYNLYIKCNHNKEFIKNLKNNLILEILNDPNNTIIKEKISKIFDFLERKFLRQNILLNKKRLDNRNLDDIRNLNIEIGFLRSPHGSSVFTRGETQSIVTVTLGTYKDAQLIDCPFFSCYKNNFILHYNFPPYAVNEIGNINIIKRREIGHGNLAKNSLNYIIPLYDEFPYIIRLVSEITESNGSSSMATVCSSSLALMNAGVPIKNHVAGIAMGLIKENDNYIILSDISSTEDFIGDMDFKIAGTKNGFTGLQMDLKIPGIEIKLIEDIIKNAKNGLIKILDVMNSTISKPNEKLSSNVQKIKILHINKNKIKDIIGKNGSIIKELIEKYESDINISNDGIIRISSKFQENIDSVVNEIKNIIKEIKIGSIFNGKVIKLVQFGAFINITHKTDGLLHISKIIKYKNTNPKWEIKEGDYINVIISNIDIDGKISLNIY